MTRYRWLLGILAGIVAVAGAQGTSTRVVSAQPPIPALYSGTATVVGVPVPDDLLISARIEGYASEPVAVQDGQYKLLQVAPPEGDFRGKLITFHLDGVQADQSDMFRSASFDFSFDLTFPRLPVPTPTPTVEPTETPIPTATPETAQPTVYSGPIVVAGGAVPEGAELVARIGSYESHPALIQDQGYINLVVDPNDKRLIGQTVEFFLNGVRSSTTDFYVSGKFNFDFGLIFVGVPTPTATAVPPSTTPTTVPPTPMPTSTQTPVPPTSTPLRPTSTATAVPPTATPAPSTPATPGPALVPAGSEPTATPVPSAGFCGSTGRSTPTSAGVGSLLALLAPVGMIAGYRRWRRR